MRILRLDAGGRAELHQASERVAGELIQQAALSPAQETGIR
jgi:hypothetical protein